MVEYASTAHSFETGEKEPRPDPQVRFADAVWAYTILRLCFGANIMLHGVSRLVAGHAAFLAYLTHYFEKTPAVPASLLPIFATDAAVGGDRHRPAASFGFVDAVRAHCRRAGDDRIGDRFKPGAGLDDRRIAVNLCVYLLLFAGAAGIEPDLPGRGFGPMSAHGCRRLRIKQAERQSKQDQEDKT